MQSGEAHAEPEHLLVLMHGLSGHSSQMSTLAAGVQSRFGDKFMCHAITANQGSFPLMHPTSDGIEAGSARAEAEVRSVISANPSLRYISLLGNSLGGLYVRFLAGQLLDAGPDAQTLAGLTPVNFILTVSPQLGVRMALYSFEKTAGKLILGQTVRDLLLEHSPGTRPLLVQISDRDSRFMRALRLFRRRSTYANCEGDHQVPYVTASLGAQSRAYPTDFGDDSVDFDRLAYPHIVGIHQLTPPSEVDTKANESLALEPESWEMQIAMSLRTLDWTLVTMHFSSWGGSTFVHNSPIVTSRMFTAGRDIVAHIVAHILCSG